MTRRILVLAALLATLAGATAASAATPDQLPGLGYSVTMTTLRDGVCHSWKASGFGATADLGSDCDAGFQAALDSFVAGHDERKLGLERPAAVAARASLSGKGYSVSTDYGVPTFRVTGGCGIDSTVDSAGLAALDAALAAAAPCPTTTAATTATTTTETATVTAPTTTSSPAAAPTVTTTAAADPATDATIAELEARIADLEAKIAALTTRVDRLSVAGEAAWLAFQQATEAGADTATAAEIARGTYLNAEYGLGAFAPAG